MRSVDEELVRQTKALHGDAQHPVHSVRMSNLVIFCDRREQAERLADEASRVVEVHPARVLLVLGEAGLEARGLSTSVWVRRLASRNDPCACFEMVTLDAAGAAVGRLPFAVRALLVGDLPINLWWMASEPPPLAGAFLFDLAENAQQIIYDSRGWPAPTRAVAATASWLQGIAQGLRGGRWRVASDLNWRRLKYWRRLLVQTLQPAATPGAIGTATDLLIEHGPQAEMQAWELVSWMTHRLGWKVRGGKAEPGIAINWRLEAPHGLVTVRIQASPTLSAAIGGDMDEIRQIRLRCHLEDKPATLVFRAVDTTRLEAVTEGVATTARTITVQPRSLAELVGRQLSDRDRDPVFVECMAVAQALAQSLD
jgi:glucose-6-phosphate dehydrogenase assembly protein OpcA